MDIRGRGRRRDEVNVFVERWFIIFLFELTEIVFAYMFFNSGAENGSENCTRWPLFTDDGVALKREGRCTSLFGLFFSIPLTSDFRS